MKFRKWNPYYLLSLPRPHYIKAKEILKEKGINLVRKRIEGKTKIKFSTSRKTDSVSIALIDLGNRTLSQQRKVGEATHLTSEPQMHRSLSHQVLLGLYSKNESKNLKTDGACFISSQIDVQSPSLILHKGPVRAPQRLRQGSSTRTLREKVNIPKFKTSKLSP